MKGGRGGDGLCVGREIMEFPIVLLRVSANSVLGKYCVSAPLAPLSNLLCLLVGLSSRPTSQ